MCIRYGWEEIKFQPKLLRRFIEAEGAAAQIQAGLIFGELLAEGIHDAAFDGFALDRKSVV